METLRQAGSRFGLTIRDVTTGSDLHHSTRTASKRGDHGCGTDTKSRVDDHRSSVFLHADQFFTDKAVLGLAAVPIMQDLGLTPKQFGLVGSSFFFLFSLSAILVGFVANRVAARLVILALALSWALVQFPMAGAVGLATLLACRILLGAGEGPAFSVAVHAL